MVEDIVELVVGIILIVVFVDALGPIVLESLRDAFGFWGMFAGILVVGIVGLAALIDALDDRGGR